MRRYLEEDVWRTPLRSVAMADAELIQLKAEGRGVKRMDD